MAFLRFFNHSFPVPGSTNFGYIMYASFVRSPLMA
jgi:hypothetical protein